MARLLMAALALSALAGCTTGHPYAGVEGGPTTVSHLRAN